MGKKVQESRRAESGFTLIELLVVIVILGILAAVVVFAVGGLNDRGQDSAYAADATTIRTAQEAFCAKNGRYAASTTELADAKLLSSAGTYHEIQSVGVTGSCAADPAGPSGYRIVCAATEPGCGSGGATPRGGTLRVAGGTDVSGANFLNPAATSSGLAHPNTEYMFNGLMRWAENNTAVPDLAESVNISPNQQTATFTLRAAQFHDAVPLEAHDVDYTYRSAVLRYQSRTQGSMVPAFGGTLNGADSTIPPEAITFPDPDGAGPLVGGPNGRGVQFNFVTPYAPLTRQLNVTEAPIIPEHIYGACPATGAGNVGSTACAPNNPPAGDLIAANATRHIGTGPFMLKERNTTTNTLTLVANTNYHFFGLPLVDELLQIPVAAANTGAALQATTGGVDVASVPGNLLPPLTGPTIITGPDFVTAGLPRGTGGGNCILTWGFNLWQNGKTPAAIQADIAATPTKRGDHPIFGDPTLVDPDSAGPEPFQPRGLVVRKAITMALDRTLLFNNIEFGKGRVPDSAYHSKLTGAYAPQSMLAFNTATADAWLDAAGWSDATNPRQSTGAAGMPATGTPLTFNSHGFSTTPQATYFTQVSNQLAAAPINVGVTSIATSNGPGGAGAFTTRAYDSMFFSVCQGDDPVIGARRTIHSSQISETPFSNMSGYYNPTVDNLWDTAFGASYTPNHGQIQSIVVSEAPMVWISETQPTRAWKSNCGGFNNQNTGLYAEAASCG